VNTTKELENSSLLPRLGVKVKMQGELWSEEKALILTVRNVSPLVKEKVGSQGGTC